MHFPRHLSIPLGTFSGGFFALLALVALRRREPDRATATHWHEHDDGMSGVQTDPYPWQVLEA